MIRAGMVSGHRNQPGDRIPGNGQRAAVHVDEAPLWPDPPFHRRGDHRSAGAGPAGSRDAAAALPDPHAQMPLVKNAHKLDVDSVREQGILFQRTAGFGEETVIRIFRHV